MIKDILILCVFFFCVFVVLSKNIIQDIERYDKKKLDINDIKSGDLFLVSYTGYYSILAKTLTGHNFIHPSLAVWENGELFIIEFANYHKYLQGLVKFPFKDWIRFNRNTKILKNSLKIKNDSKEEREKISRNILKTYDKYSGRFSEFSNFFNLNYFRFVNMFGKYDNISKEENITCTEVMAFLIYESQISDKSKHLTYFRSSTFVGYQGFDLKNEYYCDENYILEL